MQPVEQDQLAPARPIRMFARPEEIPPPAEVPDGPPVRFRWRHVMHEVTAVEGPERIAMEWWRDEAGPRAHARLFPGRKHAQACAPGCIATVFTAARRNNPHWFLHGLFA